jgi:hypothetical protein
MRDPDAAAEAAQRAAAQRLGPGTYFIDSMEERRWPNAALGCPKPGESYASMVIDGYEITVVGGGRTLVFHTNGNGRNIVLASER